MKTFTGIEEVCASIKFLDWLLAGALAWPIVVVTHDALWAGCKPDYFKPPFFIKSMGVCAFDPETLSYAGTPVQQAMCLMRGMDVSRNLLPRLSSLPAPLANRIGQTTGLPSRATLSNYLAQQGLEGDLGDYLWLPVSRARNNDLGSPMARYFVIHDTSGPNYGHRAFPDDIDQSPKLNDLRNFYCPDGWSKAHVFISRTGELLVGHDYSIAWRERRHSPHVAEVGAAIASWKQALIARFAPSSAIRRRPRAPRASLISASAFWLGRYSIPRRFPAHTCRAIAAVTGRRSR